MDHSSLFTAHRPRMLAAAFHITGSRADAEDVVQDSWLAWSKVDLDAVRAPGPFLSVLVSRRALNAVRTQRRRRETYPGPWLPDPIVDDGSPEWAALQRDGLGQALDFVLATLPPSRRRPTCSARCSMSTTTPSPTSWTPHQPRRANWSPAHNGR